MIFACIICEREISFYSFLVTYAHPRMHNLIELNVIYCEQDFGNGEKASEIQNGCCQVRRINQNGDLLQMKKEQLNHIIVGVTHSNSCLISKLVVVGQTNLMLFEYFLLNYATNYL